jgi:hypothetical protein
MSIEFEENKPLNYNYPTKKSGLTNLIIKMGLAKDEAGTKKVMIIITIVCFALSIYFFLK